MSHVRHIRHSGQTRCVRSPLVCCIDRETNLTIAGDGNGLDGSQASSVPIQVQPETPRNTRLPTEEPVRRARRRIHTTAEKPDTSNQRPDPFYPTPPKTPRSVSQSERRRSFESGDGAPGSSSRPSAMSPIARGRTQGLSSGYNSGPGASPSRLQTYLRPTSPNVQGPHLYYLVCIDGES